MEFKFSQKGVVEYPSGLSNCLKVTCQWRYQRFNPQKQRILLSKMMKGPTYQKIVGRKRQQIDITIFYRSLIAFPKTKIKKPLYVPLKIGCLGFLSFKNYVLLQGNLFSTFQMIIIVLFGLANADREDKLEEVSAVARPNNYITDDSIGKRSTDPEASPQYMYYPYSYSGYPYFTYGKRSADAESTANPEASPQYMYYPYSFSGYPYFTYGKRSADAEPTANPEASPQYMYYPYSYSGYPYFTYGKRSADAESHADPKANPQFAYYPYSYSGYPYLSYGKR